MASIVFIIILLSLSNTFFYIGPWWHKSGVFNITDVGNILIFIIFLVSPIVYNKSLKSLINPISPLIFIYLVIATIQIPIASLYYNQSYFDGVVGIRHQFYYLSFFIFLFNYSNYKTHALLDTIVWFSIILIFLGLINYFGFNFIYHKYGEGHGMRSGIVRGFLPGMDIISFSLIWIFTKWNSSKKAQIQNVSTIIVLTAAHFFRQSRMRIISVFLTIVVSLVAKKKWLHICALSFLFIIATSILSYTMKENIIFDIFLSAYNEFTTESGTWAPRIKQIKTSLNEFMNHPLFGSGVSAIRSVSDNFSSLLHIKLQEISYKHDLGYIHFLKSYGLVGALWFLLFFGIQILMCYKTKRYTSYEDTIVIDFCLNYIFFVLISFITLNQLMFPQRIVLICLNASFIASISVKYRLIRKQSR